MSEFLDVREVAEILRMSPAHVTKHAAELGGFRVGTLWRFNAENFRRLGVVPAPLPLPCPEPEPAQPASTTEKHGASIPSDSTTTKASGERTGHTKTVRTPKLRRRLSDSAFARDFPEYANG